VNLRDGVITSFVILNIVPPDRVAGQDEFFQPKPSKAEVLKRFSEAILGRGDDLKTAGGRSGPESRIAAGAVKQWGCREGEVSAVDAHVRVAAALRQHSFEVAMLHAIRAAHYRCLLSSSPVHYSLIQGKPSARKRQNTPRVTALIRRSN
jgi:hypothetical protein